MNVGEKMESSTTAKKKSKSKSNPPAAEVSLERKLEGHLQCAYLRHGLTLP